MENYRTRSPTKASTAPSKLVHENLKTPGKRRDPEDSHGTLFEVNRLI